MAAQAVGSRADYMFLEESTYGVTPNSTTANTFKIPFTSDTIVQQINPFTSAEIRSDRMVPSIVQGNKRVQGALNFELSCDNHAKLLKHLLGPVSADSISGNMYQHQIDAGTSLPVGISIQKGFNDINQYFLFKGCRLNRGTFNFPQEGFITCSVDFLGREVATGSVTLNGIPTVYTDDPITSFVAVLSQSSYGGSLTQVAHVQSATITVENSMKEDNFVIGDGRRVSIPEGKRVVRGSMTVFFEDLSLYNSYMNGTYSQLQIVATKSTGQSWTWFLPKIMYAGNSPLPVVPNDRPIVVTLPFQAVRDPVTFTDLRMTVVNNVPTL